VFSKGAYCHKFERKVSTGQLGKLDILDYKRFHSYCNGYKFLDKGINFSWHHWRNCRDGTARSPESFVSGEGVSGGVLKSISW
jgi:hypothetical protein